jgi:hypothetical protein
VQPKNEAHDANRNARPTCGMSGFPLDNVSGAFWRSRNESETGRTSDQQRSYNKCVAGTHPRFDMIADAHRVPRIPAFGGSIVRSEMIPANDEAIRPVAAGHVLTGSVARRVFSSLGEVRWKVIDSVDVARL